MFKVSGSSSWPSKQQQQQQPSLILPQVVRLLTILAVLIVTRHLRLGISLGRLRPAGVAPAEGLLARGGLVLLTLAHMVVAQDMVEMFPKNPCFTKRRMGQINHRRQDSLNGKGYCLCYLGRDELIFLQIHWVFTDVSLIQVQKSENFTL